MKHEKKLSFLTTGLLAFIIALAGVGCINSAFHLYADMSRLSVYLMLWTVFSALCFSFRRGGTVFLCTCAIFLGFAYREGTLEREMESLLFHLSTFYDGGYQCGVIYWTSPDLQDVSVDGGLFLIGAAIASIQAFVLCRRKNELPAMLAAIIPLAICLVVTDTIPSEPWLFLLLISLALLLFTHPVRKKRIVDGIRLTAMLLIPILLSGTLLFALSPQDAYGENMNALQQYLLNSFLSEIPDQTQQGTMPDPNAVAKDQVNLTTIGKKEESDKVVLDALAGSAQTLYLRDRSYDVYDGLSWTSSDSSTGTDPYWPTENLTDIGFVQISTKIRRDNILLPYYIAAETWAYTFEKGAYPNPSQKQYSYYQKALIDPAAGLAIPVDYQSALLQQCLQLPEKTAQDWREILEQVQIPAGAAPADAAQQIRDFVRNSAEYDLDTDVMPQGLLDFGIWFLNESESGYCVHFATAATMLLRAQGIPARYVTGFSTDVQRGIRKTVTEKESHAWVEYLDPQLGWQILEATPGFSVITPVPPEVTQPTQPTDPIETNPPETTAPTEPTETDPTKPTTPTDPTQTEPSETTVPTDATEPTDPGQAGLVGSGDGQGTGNWQQIRSVMFYILGVILAITLIIAQRGMRIRRRRKRMYSGEANKQAIARWKHVLRLRRLLRQKMPAHLHELAQKAAYSQHTLTKQELEQFDIWLDEAKKALQAKPWYLRWVYKWVFAVL